MNIGKKDTPKGMVEFVHDEGLARFTVPEKPTVRQQLEYLGGASIYNEADRFVQWWEGATALIDDWECELLPNLEEIDLDKLHDPKAATIITWASMKCRMHMNALDETPKN